MVNTSELFQWNLKITGRVQGVGYRWFVEKTANYHGITGWVKNCADSSVEALLEGNIEVLREVYLKLQQGPSLSLVQNITLDERAVTERQYKNFSITY